jgi:hypothetical protein
MTIHAIDESQRGAARVAGLAFLIALAISVLANYVINGIDGNVIVPGNAADTARNIRMHETMFRVNLACDVIYVATLLVLSSALFEILKPVNRNLALIAAFCRLVLAAMCGITALNTLGALRLLSAAPYLPLSRTDQLQTLARLNLASGYDTYYVGLPFWGLASMVCSFLWFKSGYISRALASFGVISSAWCVIYAFAFIVFPYFEATVNAYWFVLPMTIFEIVLGFWLLFKGLNPSGLPGLDKAGERTNASIS